MLSPFDSISLNLQDQRNHNDVLMFVQDRLALLDIMKVYSEAKICKMAKRLVDTSGGLFLWAFLALEHILLESNVALAVEKAVKATNLDEVVEKDVAIQISKLCSQTQRRICETVSGICKYSIITTALSVHSLTVANSPSLVSPSSFENSFGGNNGPYPT
ncbi:hypothetical protein HDU98_006952 [Podochytrium sp. JEL0797]|nr:hypothetical protein HDU98_006952 [Podochytrium sp. JEL0797]